MADRLPTATELRGLPAADLATQLDALRQQLWQARIKIQEGSLQQGHQIRLLRRQMARVSTVLQQQRNQKGTGS